MDRLQDIFEGSMRERVLAIAVDRVVRKIEESGVRVSGRQRRRIGRAIENGESFSLHFWGWPPWHTRAIQLELSDEDITAITEQWDSLLEETKSAVPAFAERWEPIVREEILRSYPAEISEDARAESAFRQRLATRWSTPLTLLKVIVALSERLAYESQSSEELAADDENADAVLESVLRRLHARGVRIAKEGLVLLQSGYPDGAMARWRTLHELTTIALFIQAHGEKCARHFLEHDAVENYRSAQHYRRAQEKLGFEPISDSDFALLAAACRRAVDHHGKHFESDYGWAHAFLQGRATNFAEIESSLSLAHLRPFYRMASQQVHAGPNGILFGLSHDHEEVVLLGPSNVGLADPGQSIGLTLSLLTTVLISLRPSIDLMVGVKVQASLADAAALEWVECQNQLDADEA